MSPSNIFQDPLRNHLANIQLMNPLQNFLVSSNQVPSPENLAKLLRTQQQQFVDTDLLLTLQTLQFLQQSQALAQVQNEALVSPTGSASSGGSAASSINSNNNNSHRKLSHSVSNPETSPSSASPAASSSGSVSGSQANLAQSTGASRYKTELCRSFSENGTCKYGAKCQFAHGQEELRHLSRHPKYKTERCRSFYGGNSICPYGTRCHFIHDQPVDETAKQPSNNLEDNQRRHHSSFSDDSSSQSSLSVSPSTVCGDDSGSFRTAFPFDVLQGSLPLNGLASHMPPQPQQLLTGADFVGNRLLSAFNGTPIIAPPHNDGRLRCFSEFGGL